MRHRFRIILFFEGATIGIFTGVTIALLRFLIDKSDQLRPIWFSNFEIEKFLITLCGLFFVAKFLSFAMNFDKQVGGSGIPQIKSILQHKARMKNPLQLLALKFISVVLAIGAGMSLGRAGVSVQFGACVGNFFSKIFHSKFKNNFLESEILLTAGASAGFSAVFGAPLAGVIFCIEELHKKFSAEFLVATVTASISAAAVVELFFGIRPIFETITSTPNLLYSFDQAKLFVSFIFLAILVGIAGAFFTKSLLFSLNCYEKLKLQTFYKILIPLILIIPIGRTCPQILGCGNVLVDEILTEKFILSTVLIFFAGKFLFTLICFGTNAPGGLFLPILTLGALFGNIFANIGAANDLFSAEWTTLFVVFGMSAMLAAVVKTPITGSILIMELTGQFSYLLILIIVSGAAFLISDLCGGEPIFSALLNRKK